jgi:hypothetical protein
MLHISRWRRRLFYWPQVGVRPFCVLLALVPHVLGQTPSLTTISDTVYRADGSYAAGTLLVSWPAFTTASGATVAAGNKNVTLGPNGSFTAQLVPNAGATPAGTIYTVTYQLTDGTVKTENWSIGTTSPETISQVRTLAGTGTPLTQAATQQYVNAQLATVVHLSGTETITGAKQFTVPPSLPTPSQSSQAANKAYVDSVTNSGGGNFVSKAGDTMTGPLTLPADPIAPQQAADKHYVDLAAGSKADLVSGRVPTSELGAGTANNGVCLHGDSTWGGCTGNEFTTNVQMDAGLTVTGSVQASSFVSTGSGPWSLQGGFGTLNVAPSGQSLIGFGSNGKLQVSENGGALLEVAKLDTSGNIATAVALSQTPTQCTGSFATGIQANGNANCSTADQIQLAETTPPTGIPNYGIFWFDSTCHCPKVIDNNGQAVQLGLTNVFNQDSSGTNPSNTLEEVNGTSPQAFRVYGTWTDATDWERTGLSWDQADTYFVLKNENAGSGSQRGIGFWIGSNIRWAIDTASALKPFTDNSYNVGSATLRPKTVYAATSFDMSTTGAQTFEICNDSTTGTSLNFLAKLNGANPSCAVKLATTDVSSAMGVVSGGSGTSGNAVIAYRGYASCSFDGATSAGDYVQISSTNAGDCHDTGSTYPSSGQVLGRVLSTNAAAGTYTTLLGPEVLAASGAVSSAFGRTGAVVAASGDYTVSQVTGAAPLASPALTGTPTAPTPSTSDNSTKVATTAYVQAQGYAAGSGMTSGNYPKATSSAALGDSGVNAGPYSIPWITVYRGGGSSSFSTSTNVVKLWGVVLIWPVTTTQVSYNVSTADTNTSGSCNYDIGIADTSGNIKLHIGSTANQTFGSSGAHTVTWSGGGSTTLQPGKYYVAFSTSCTANSAVLSGDGSAASVTFQNAGIASITAGGSLTSFTPPSDAWSWGATVPAIVVR